MAAGAQGFGTPIRHAILLKEGPASQNIRVDHLGTQTRLQWTEGCSLTERIISWENQVDDEIPPGKSCIL